MIPYHSFLRRISSPSFTQYSAVPLLLMSVFPGCHSPSQKEQNDLAREFGVNATTGRQVLRICEARGDLSLRATYQSLDPDGSGKIEGKEHRTINELDTVWLEEFRHELAEERSVANGHKSFTDTIRAINPLD